MQVEKMTKKQFLSELKRTVKKTQPTIMNGGIHAIIMSILLGGNTNGNDPYFNNTGSRKGAGKGTGGLVIGGMKSDRQSTGKKA